MSKITIKGNKENVCPYCGSRDLEWSGGAEFCDDSIMYAAECNNCGRDFQVWYDLVFSGNYIYNGDGEYIKAVEGDVIKVEDE